MNPLLSMQENRPAPSVSSENGAELTSRDGAGVAAVGLCGLFVTRVAARTCPHCEIQIHYSVRRQRFRWSDVVPPAGFEPATHGLGRDQTGST